MHMTGGVPGLQACAALLGSGCRAQACPTRAAAFGVFSTYVALYRRYPRSGSRSYLPTRAAPLALAHKSYLPTPGSLGEGGNPADSCTAHEECEPGFQKRRNEEKRRQGKARNKKRSTGPLPRGPPPQYYPSLTSLFGWEAVSQADMAALMNLPRARVRRGGTDIMMRERAGERCVLPQHVQCESARRATGMGAPSHQARPIPRTVSACASTLCAAAGCRQVLFSVVGRVV